MELNCLNCNQPITANFCGNCGQKKYKRIDRKYILDEVQYTFIHTNKGFLYSVKNIIKNPGKTARNFIEGNRVNHYKPILLAFVLSGISAFISYKIIGFAEIMKKFYSGKTGSSPAMDNMMSVLNSYNSIFMLLLIPFFAILSKIVFRKWGHNYYEHIIMNSYVLSFYTLFNIIIVYPILYFMRDNLDLFSMFSGLSMLSTVFILIWFYKEFYSGHSLKSIILRVFGIFGLLIAAYFIITIMAVIGVTIYSQVKGKHPIEHTAPANH